MIAYYYLLLIQCIDASDYDEIKRFRKKMFGSFRWNGKNAGYRNNNLENTQSNNNILNTKSTSMLNTQSTENDYFLPTNMHITLDSTTTNKNSLNDIVPVYILNGQKLRLDLRHDDLVVAYMLAKYLSALHSIDNERTLTGYRVLLLSLLKKLNLTVLITKNMNIHNKITTDNLDDLIIDLIACKKDLLYRINLLNNTTFNDDVIVLVIHPHLIMIGGFINAVSKNKLLVKDHEYYKICIRQIVLNK